MPAGQRPTHTWFLKIDSVQIVTVCVRPLSLNFDSSKTTQPLASIVLQVHDVIFEFYKIEQPIISGGFAPTTPPASFLYAFLKIF